MRNPFRAKNTAAVLFTLPGSWSYPILISLRELGHSGQCKVDMFFLSTSTSYYSMLLDCAIHYIEATTYVQ